MDLEDRSFWRKDLAVLEETQLRDVSVNHLLWNQTCEEGGQGYQSSRGRGPGKGSRCDTKRGVRLVGGQAQRILIL